MQKAYSFKKFMEIALLLEMIFLMMARLVLPAFFFIFVIFASNISVGVSVNDKMREDVIAINGYIFMVLTVYFLIKMVGALVGAGV